MSLIISYMGVDTAAADIEAAQPDVAKLMRTGWWTPAPKHRDDGGSTLTVVDVNTVRDAVFAQILSKIPAGITRVLDIGCGNGDFAKVLHETRPGVIYRGLDLSKENIAHASSNLEVGGVLPGNVELEEGNVWEYLRAVDPPDWDFIISTRCVFNETTRGGDRELLRLIDATAPKGWFVYGHLDRLLRTDLQYVMTQALAGSTNPTEFYFKDNESYTRDWLLQDVVWLGEEKEHPAYIVRDATLLSVPPQRSKRYDTMKNGTYEKNRAQATLKFNGGMTEYKTSNIDANGRVTGEAVVLKANAPADVKLVEYEQKLANIELKKENKG